MKIYIYIGVGSLSKKKSVVAVLIVLFVAALAIGSYFFFWFIPLNEMRIAVAGANHTVAIAKDGSLWAWGLNDRGQLGDGTTMNRNRPVQISSERDWVSVSAYNHNVAIRADGSLWAWGDNSHGQLGDGTTYHRARPVQIGADTDWASVEVFWSKTYAIKEDGSLWHWGAIRNYAFDPDNPYSIRFIDVLEPTQVGTDTDWKSISSGGSNTSAIKTDGTLWVWGFVWNDVNRPIIYSYNPLQLGTDTDWVSVATTGGGIRETIGIKTDGTLWSWHLTEDDEMSAPVQIGVETTWAAVDTGFTSIAAISTDGRLWTWGRSQWGEFGDGTREYVRFQTPVKVGEFTDWISVSAGPDHTVAIRADGSLWATGRDIEGQLGGGNDPESRWLSLYFEQATRRLLGHRIGRMDIIEHTSE